MLAIISMTQIFVVNRWSDFKEHNQAQVLGAYKTIESARQAQFSFATGFANDNHYDLDFQKNGDIWVIITSDVQDTDEEWYVYSVQEISLSD